jgi:hypothetical protein
MIDAFSSLPRLRGRDGEGALSRYSCSHISNPL